MNIDVPRVSTPPQPPPPMVLPTQQQLQQQQQSYMNPPPSQNGVIPSSVTMTTADYHHNNGIVNDIEQNKNAMYHQQQHHILPHHHLASTIASSSSSMYPPPMPPSLPTQSVMSSNFELPSNHNEQLMINPATGMSSDNSISNQLMSKRKLDESMIDDSKKQKFGQEYSESSTNLQQQQQQHSMEYSAFGLQQHQPPPHQLLHQQHQLYHNYPAPPTSSIPPMISTSENMNSMNHYIGKSQEQQQPQHPLPISVLPPVPSVSNSLSASNSNDDIHGNSSKIFSAENLLKPDVRNVTNVNNSSFGMEEQNINSAISTATTATVSAPSTTTPTTTTNASDTKLDEAMKIHEKLREMGEISVKPVNKSSETKRKDGEGSSSGFSVEIKKKTTGDKTETDESKRITNLRKNIREVMDENQLDATTLAAQRQESERLARVQEQQKLIRELQRQMAVERQNNRTQSKVLSLLQGQNSLLKNNRNDRSISLPSSSADMYVVKGIASEVTFNKNSGFIDIDKISSGNLTPSVSIAPVRRNKVSTPTTEDSMSDSESKKEVVTIVDSSSEDDCIVLSDDDEDVDEEPEDDPHNSGLHVNDAFNVPDEKGQVVVNIGHPEGEPDIFVAPQIARVIKPHQIGGVRFLFDNIIESTERFSTSTGFGCILAHSMGLGKTLQVVCFCDIFLRHTNSKSVLCIMPINTLQNWVAEFNMWLPEEPEKSPMRTHGEVRPRNFRIFILNDQHKTLTARAKVILEWEREGGVLLIGYELFRLLSLKLSNKKKKSRKMQPEKEEKIETPAHRELMENIYAALVRPGPDLVICDEGHRIKNSHASISVALKQIRSKRRIVLTGYPLQNNLLEYWCMVDFVRPNYLGTKTEFSNMFERPIQNGQCIDSTPQDIKLMRYRAHVLHSLLVGFVQRRSHAVLQNTLPQKEEYVILVRMTPFQRKLYNVFMNEVVRTKAVPNPLKAFAVCCKIWNHPDVLYNFLKKREADLDLELEEVEADGTKKGVMMGAAVGGMGGQVSMDATMMTAAGRRRRATKKSKEVIKNGKNIPAIEVPPQNMPTDSLQQQQQQHQLMQQQHQQHQQMHPQQQLQHQQLQQHQQQQQQQSQQFQHQHQIQQQQMQHQQQQQQLQQHQQQIVVKEEKSNSNPMTPTTQLSNLSLTSSSSLQDLKFNTAMQQQNRYPSQQNETNGMNNFPSQVTNGQSSMPPPYGVPYAGYPSSYGTEGSYYPQYDNFYPQEHFPGSDYSTMGYNAQPQNSFWENNSSFFGGYNPTAVGESSSSVNSYSHSNSSFGNSVTSSSSSSKGAEATMQNEKKPPPPPNTNTNGSNINQENSSSSELVDLDTKEIKTVETTINAMEMLKELDEKKNIKEANGGVKEEAGEKKDGQNDDEKQIKSELKDEDLAVTSEKEIKPAKEDGIPYEWAVELMKGYIPDLLENSPKMEIFFRLLEESLRLGDRILVFSQSLLTLNLIERFLQMTKLPGLDYNWVKNKTYFRLDGSTTAIEREKLINEFNANPDIHLFLVSTRAGSLGINLVGANRVIVFDASWNPCHDTQAVCRVYRYGQKKPCFVYRIVMDNCLEKKIYDRQVNKQGMSDRVVDECNPDAHLSIKEVTNLCYDTEEDSEWKDIGDCKDKYLDIVMQKVIEMHRSLLSKEPFQHESLLVDRKEKKLSQAEKRLAQRGYEMEKRAATKPSFVYHSVNTQYRVMRTADGSIVHRPVASVRPMQAEMTDKHISRPGGIRPTRWIPAEVWQRQGMTAQEMTLPLDVVIPTSSGDKSNIVLKAGQKVMVLKSPKGIYMQLESGKIIAIRTSFKVNQNNRGGNGGNGGGEKTEDDCEITTPNSDDQIKKEEEKIEGTQETNPVQITKSTTMTTASVVATSVTPNQQQSSTDLVTTAMAGNVKKENQNLKSSQNFVAARPIYSGGTVIGIEKQKPIEVNPQLQQQTTTTAAFKPQSNIYSPARQFVGTTSTNNTGSKNFNVQHLIDMKKPSTQSSSSNMSHHHHQYPKIAPNNTNTNTDDVVMVENDSEFYSSSQQLRKSSIMSQHQQQQQQQHLHQSAKYPGFSSVRGTKFGPGSVNIRPHHHSPQNNMANVNMANVKPQHFHETSNQKWERGRPAENKSAFQTITIDDDFEPPLREKVIYKPNLTERKPKSMVTTARSGSQGIQQQHQIQSKQQQFQHQHQHQHQQQQHQQYQQHQQQQQSLLPSTKQDRPISAAVSPAVVGNTANNNGSNVQISTATSMSNRGFYPESSQSPVNSRNSVGPLKHSMSQHLQSSKMLPQHSQSQGSVTSKSQYPEMRQKQQPTLPQSQTQYSHQNQNLQSQTSHQNSQHTTQKHSDSSRSNSMRSPKPPSIKNIPAPYPSIYAPHGQNANIQSQQLQPQTQNSQQFTTTNQQQQQQQQGSGSNGTSTAPPPTSVSYTHQQNKVQEKIPNTSANPATSQANLASATKTTSAASESNSTSSASTENQVSSVPATQSQSQSQQQTQSQSQSQTQSDLQYSHYSTTSNSSTLPSHTSSQQYSVPPVPAPTPHLESSFYAHHESPYQHHYPNLYAAATAAAATSSPYNYASHAHSAYSPYASYHHSPYDLNSYSSSAATAVPPSYSTPLPPHHPSTLPTTPDVSQYHHQYSMYAPPHPPPPPSTSTVHHQPPSISEQYNSYYPYSYPPAGAQWRPQ